jgi:hypothetical protein
MPERDLKATIPAAVADRIATTVSAFQTGRIDLGGGMTMALPPEVGFNVKRMAGFARITPTETVRIEGGLVDVFLEFVDVFPKGSRSTFRAQFKRFGFEGQREFGPAPSAPMAGALGLASIPGPEADATTLAPLLTLLVEPAEPDWIVQIRHRAELEGIDPAVAIKAVQAVRTEFPLVPSGRRKVRTPSHRQAMRAGAAAAGVSSKWLALWWLCKWFVPAPIRLIIEGVEWAIKTFVVVDGEGGAE